MPLILSAFDLNFAAARRRNFFLACGIFGVGPVAAPTNYAADVYFDFNILTAFIRLGRARPAGAGCPPYKLYIMASIKRG